MSESDRIALIGLKICSLPTGNIVVNIISALSKYRTRGCSIFGRVVPLTVLSGSSLYWGHIRDSFIAIINCNYSSNNDPRTIMNPDLGVISISILRSIYRVVVLVPFTLDKNDYGSTVRTANTNMRFKNPGTMVFAAVAVTSTSCMQRKAIILWATPRNNFDEPFSSPLLPCTWLDGHWMVTKCFICASTGTLSITLPIEEFREFKTSKRGDFSILTIEEAIEYYLARLHLRFRR
ncbi:MAG: hypothetical protein NXY57DRAFT_1038862 [Lentinula lateritia]|nr:MAG: hypothetical protein NXY57DRAFT_1038862 [Lentinula lateritia]